jgi:hypothetical protein
MKITSNENQIAWVNIPHQGKPEIFGPFDTSTELMEWVQEYESSEKYNTVPIPDIKDVEDFFDDARRQYHAAYEISCEDMIKSIKTPETHGHLAVERIRVSKKFVFDNWYDEAREDFIDGFKETYGSETRTDAEKDWDAWSNNIQGGADSLGFEEELQGYSRGKELGKECKQMKEEN